MSIRMQLTVCVRAYVSWSAYTAQLEQERSTIEQLRISVQKLIADHNETVQVLREGHEQELEVCEEVVIAL